MPSSVCEGGWVSRLARKYATRVLMFVASVSLVMSRASAEPKDSSTLFEYKEPGSEFTIQVPPRWAAEPGTQRYAVTLKPTSAAERVKLPGGLIADPSITVAAVKKPIVFNDESLEQIAREIEENFIRYNGAGSGFQIFQKNLLSDLPGGKKALLYYVTFKTDGVEAGQAILVTGNDTVRYRVTLSDHKLNFDKNLELYYPFMVSIDFKTPVANTEVSPTSALEQVLRWGLLVILAGVVLGFLSRGKRTRRRSRTEGIKSSRSYRKRSESTDKGGLPKNSQFDSLSSGMASTVSEHPRSSAHLDSDAHAFSTAPTSSFGLPTETKTASPSRDAAPLFSEKDLSAPPQSIPLSQVVDESSTPPSTRKKWQIFKK